ncbi:MAG: hypothetical protein Q8R16_03740, partial [bacterium]|nr:hypothetical protein [bacterium]
KISGLTKTPASTVEGTLTETVVKTPKDAKKTTAEQTSTALAAQDTFFPMLKAAGQALAVNFAVTLVSQTLQRQLLNKGLFLGSLFDSGSGTEESVAPPAAREQQARTAFAELQRPPFVSSGDYDQLSEFASCDPQRRQLTTCVIDEGFTQAVRRSQTGAPITVAEAITEGLLHVDWPLIEAGTAKDQDPNCAKGPPTGGYCASNLGKLRRARIVPIGWELAANHEANNVGDPVRLGQVIGAFQRNGIDGRCGTNDAEESPYCGLIDPNWVLTYPSQQCQLRGPGERLLEKGTAVRAEACVDVPSCLERDAEGKCVGGYGYCVREKNIWHLAGQSCPGQYASCRAFTSREGASLAALTATIDRGVCTAENVGCQWYASSRNVVGAWESNSRRYLNRLAEQCTEANEGCTELISTKTARLNLVSNPSFERNADGIGSPDHWALIDVVSTDGTRAADGSVAIQVTSTDFADRPVDERIPLTGDRSYVLSASALRNPGGVATPKLRVVLVFKDTLTGSGGSPAVAGMQTTCTKGTPASPEGGDGGDPNTIALYIDPGAATGYVRGSCTFVAPTSTQSAYVQIYSTEANPIWADAIQIEEGTEPSPFHEGYDPNASRTYLKAASDDLRCYDVGGDGQLNTANDHESCPSFARGCTEAEVGCERYTPQDGTPAVNGQANDIDRCPAECAGYAAFREVESNFDRRSAFDSFIPSTARQCAAEHIGCSEFTNLDALERGGEQREYFSFLRQCEKPNTVAQATYYTWEGSDSQGFQLRSFVLRSSASDVNSAPHTFDGSGDCSGSTNAIVRADCRAFYSQNGTIYPRQLSRTVLITDDCVRYRATHDTSRLVTSSGTACSPASDACKEVCAWAGGTFAGGACVFKGHRQESMQCSAAAAGCRAYRGNASGVVQTLLDSSFEATSGDAREGWSPPIGSQSSEALTVGQHSLRVPLSSTTAHLFTQVVSGLTTEQCTERSGIFTAAAGSVPSTCEVSSLVLGHTYEVLITGKGRGQADVSLMQAGTALTTPATHPMTLGPTWQLLRVGPLIVDQQPTSAAQLQLTVGAGGDAFFDQIILREVPQLTTVIKGSWQTPQQCDRASIAQDAPPLAQGMLGCRAYRPRSGPAVTLRSFSRLCSESVVGCTAFHDTQNSASLVAESFNTGTPVTDDVTVPADTLRYLVNDPAKSCAATAKGCSRLGKPTLNRIADRDNPPATAWTDAFFIDNPDRYTGPGAILCTHPALFCEEYRGQDGTVSYFRDPGSRTCEYRENVAKTSGSPASGWFKSNVDPPQACDPGLLIGGATYGIWNNADPNYAGWAGMCEASYDHCTRFVDPTDRAPAYPNGNPYHAIRTTVDFASCQGGVSQKEGCVVLSDSSDPSIRFSAEASIAASDVQQGARVPALNCDQDPESCKRCRVPRRCRAPDGHVQGDRAGEPASPASCLSDGDCVTAAGFRCRGGEAGSTCTTDANCASFGIPGEATCSSFTNDGNAIIKVQRDRSCGQWLACQSATEARDPGLQRSIEVCGSIALCDSYLPEGGGSTALRCGHWLSTAETDGQILTRSLYQQRSRGWTGQDYSGYSVSGIYQAQDLTPVDVSLKRGEIDIRLARLDPGCWGTTTIRAAPLSSVPCDRE